MFAVQVYWNTGNVLGYDDSDHAQWTDDRETYLPPNHQLTVHASELHLHISEVSLENELCIPDCHGAETTKSPENACETHSGINHVPFFTSAPKHRSKPFDGPDLSRSTPLLVDTALYLNNSKPLPKSSAQIIPQLCLGYSASTSEQCLGSGSLDSAVVFPRQDLNLVTQGSILTEEERLALQSQVSVTVCRCKYVTVDCFCRSLCI